MTDKLITRLLMVHGSWLMAQGWVGVQPGGGGVGGGRRGGEEGPITNCSTTPTTKGPTEKLKTATSGRTYLGN